MILPPYQSLSPDQDRILNQPIDRSFIVTGPPGTGKTVLALYRAHHIADQVENRENVILLMYSNLLSQYTKQGIDELDISGLVHTLHSWLPRFYTGRTGKRRIPQTEPYKFDWPQIMVDVQESGDLEAGWRYLIVDEAQDLGKDFFMLSRFLADNRTVFADENQRITDENSKLDEIRSRSGIERNYRLTTNFRNTREVAELAAVFHVGAETGIADFPENRSGPKPTVLGNSDLNDAIRFIANYEANNRSHSIGVFVKNRKMLNKFKNRLEGKTRKPVQHYGRDENDRALPVDFNDPGIVIMCYPSAKGLEFDTVFIPELHDTWLRPDRGADRMRLYVLLSRPRERLYLMYSGLQRGPVIDSIPAHLVEWNE